MQYPVYSCCSTACYSICIFESEDKFSIFSKCISITRIIGEYYSAFIEANQCNDISYGLRGTIRSIRNSRDNGNSISYPIYTCCSISCITIVISPFKNKLSSLCKRILGTSSIIGNSNSTFVKTYFSRHTTCC
jgi:hypothetical protein